jgi:hypothetical protein
MVWAASTLAAHKVERASSRDRLAEREAAVGGDGQSDLPIPGRAVERRPGRVDVILEPGADEVIDGHPLLDLDMAGGKARLIVVWLQVSAPVALDPMGAEVVAVALQAQRSTEKNGPETRPGR